MTLPVGVPPGLVTVAVNVTESPKVEVFAADEELTTVVVAGLFTVKAFVSVAVPPPGAPLVTDTLRGPTAAFAAIVTLAVICDPLSTVNVLTAMLEPRLTVVTPARKLVPVKTTFSVCVRLPLTGAMLVNVGAGLLIENGTLPAPVRPE